MNAFAPTEAELEQLCEAACRHANLPRAPFLDHLVERSLRRYPPVTDLHDDTPDPDDEHAEAPPPKTLQDLPGGIADAARFAGERLADAAASPLFELIQRVAETQDNDATTELMRTLERQLKLKSILFRHHLDPDTESPALWGRIWEAIPKWDGRNFKAYVKRIVRNYCLDEIGRKKKNPGLVDEDPRDPREHHAHADSTASRDALSSLADTLTELERSGRITPLDGLIFDLIGHSFAVADILEFFTSSPAIPAVRDALTALDTKALTPPHRIALELLADDLPPADVALITQLDPSALTQAHRALAPIRNATGEDDRKLHALIPRVGITPKQLDQATRLNANALNLRINRSRLKLWMAIVDRAYETLRRRKRLDDVDLAIVQHRCTAPTHSGCRLYKDADCKREAPLDTIARKGGLDLSTDALRRRVDDLRRIIVEEGLGLGFPDYNACMNERRPNRAKP